MLGRAWAWAGPEAAEAAALLFLPCHSQPGFDPYPKEASRSFLLSMKHDAFKHHLRDKLLHPFKVDIQH